MFQNGTLIWLLLLFFTSATEHLAVYLNLNKNLSQIIKQKYQTYAAFLKCED